LEVLATRKHYSPEFKVQFVLKCLSEHRCASRNCKERNIAPSLYYNWRKKFIDAGIQAFKKDRVRQTYVGKKIKILNPEKNVSSLKLSYAKCLHACHPLRSRLPAKVKLKTINIVKDSELSKRATLKIIEVPRSSYYRWAKKLRDTGQINCLSRSFNYVRKVNRGDLKEELFKVLHSPPSEFGFNRTTWKMVDLQNALEQSGVSLGQHTIRHIIKDAGYRWMKAKKVLTSADPDYRKKLDHIHKILGNLGKRDGFFSIDEYGPFAVKHRQGKKLIPPGQTFTVPQWQKSKGCLIMIAALELSTNQVTHFYSKKKNTEEMIKLLDLLLSKNKHLQNIYLSWDAASWHMSKILTAKIEQINRKAAIAGSTQVEVAPLPAGAQFLNVIESIFSGMARAVIHNSNYQSKKEVMCAIDRYFSERNEYFRLNPQRAGKKIWGRELVPAEFSESHNCKDKAYR